MSPVGGCIACPKGQKPSAGKQFCIFDGYETNCSASDKMVSFGVGCAYCPNGFGFDSETNRCKACAPGCDYCAQDYNRCDESLYVKKYLDKAEAKMGRTTFVLIWNSTNTDMDLYFKCKPSEHGSETQIYYGNTWTDTCKAKFDTHDSHSVWNHKLEAIRADKLTDIEYKVEFENRNSHSDYNLYIVRRWCGAELNEKFAGRDDFCQYEVVQKEKGPANGESRIYYKYRHYSNRTWAQGIPIPNATNNTSGNNTSGNNSSGNNSSPAADEHALSNADSTTLWSDLLNNEHAI